MTNFGYYISIHMITVGALWGPWILAFYLSSSVWWESITFSVNESVRLCWWIVVSILDVMLRCLMIRQQGRMPDRPSPNMWMKTLSGCLQRLQENFDHISGVTQDMETEWVMIRAANAKAAMPSCGCRVTGASHDGNPRTWWWTPEVIGAVKLKKESSWWDSCCVVPL